MAKSIQRRTEILVHSYGFLDLSDMHSQKTLLLLGRKANNNTSVTIDITTIPCYAAFEVNSMQISSRFSVAVHTLLCIEIFKDDYKVTSDFIAGSVGTNPVIIRKIMGKLKKAGLIEALAGTGGTYLLKKPEEITLLDVAQAVDLFEDDRLFGFHEAPNPDCPVGRSIHSVLDRHMSAAQAAMEQSLADVALSDLLRELPR